MGRLKNDSGNRPESPHQPVYLYRPEQLRTTARIDTDGNQEQHIRYFHTDLNGCPEELTDENGKILWECSFQLWGKRIHEIEHEPIEQNLRYQGQYLDRETGLHYNTFRYYDPDIGRFTQPDPIGLLGGFNLYQYAPNGLTWIDPLGLKYTEPKLPPKVIVKESGVTIEHYYPNDHPQGHAHVKGGGPETKIGSNGHPIKGYPELTPKQNSVVRRNKSIIRSHLNKIKKWLWFKHKFCGKGK
ncbi:RHS repeat domain-containing protein [Snodgrassella alvi]|uniref:RHS repeat domain-containing protein n=1 Tax=Snodgrassella alvi TaxID=1196083 RepID=UPI000C1DC827|nr:RHS repeat-associated core domain-containing protein [Snodgrassella alvi]